MARLRQGEQSPFEPGVVTAKPDDIEIQPAALRIAAVKAPRAIMLDESIGWMDGGVLCMFREEQLVTNPSDIQRLIQHGAKYMAVSHE